MCYGVIGTFWPRSQFSGWSEPGCMVARKAGEELELKKALMEYCRGKLLMKLGM